MNSQGTNPKQKELRQNTAMLYTAGFFTIFYVGILLTMAIMPGARVAWSIYAFFGPIAALCVAILVSLIVSRRQIRRDLTG